MAITNYERVGKALEQLKIGLAPFVDREIKDAITNNTVSMQRIREFLDDPILAKKSITEWDASALIKIMFDTWNEVFKKTLGFTARGLVQEIRDWRNKWAHQAQFSSDDSDRALDSIERLLTAISAPEADEVRKLKMELRRLVTDEQVRGERRKNAGIAIESGVSSNLMPWREIISPHKDVASGNYQQAEFAADLWQVHLGEGTDEYRDPVEFYRRTYLTESLKTLLSNGAKRIAGAGGDPVVQLQTNFGGGKTHSMLALYHLFSGANTTELLGVDEVMKEADVKGPLTANRVVLVGNKISPGNPSVKEDGTVVHTLWGELAWQLGGKKAYAKIKNDDERATNPGDTLRELFNEFGPCLILVDEWVAYARQLHQDNNLPGGDFETHFTFAQALTESAKLSKNCLLVISLPSSDTAISPHAQGDDEEVGGERGRQALSRLQNVIGRLESSWTPATAEESFEIVRRRLFEPLLGADKFKQRDVVASAFGDMYRTQQREFPSECSEVDYVKRIQSAYPIHPEVFDRLYTDWSTLIKFQRTRGVLRLMAAVIHSLWERGDKNPLILPSNIPIDEPRVRDELTRYLPDQWKPIIERDIDGPHSLPLTIDGEVSNLGKFSACRRVARTVFMGSAPITSAANLGIEERRIRLGCVMPGESPAIFGDALRRLANAATYLYEDGPRYWYSTQPTVKKLADDRAEQYKRDPDKVIAEIDKRVRRNLEAKGEFSRIHPMPQSSQDVPDDFDTRLVVLGIDHPFNKGETTNPAELAAKAILESRGNTPRIYKNTLVFLAPDNGRLQDLLEAVRKYLAWESILADQKMLNLTHQQVSQAETQQKTVDGAVTARLPETYQWLLVPVQGKPQDAQTWESLKLNGSDSLAIRASKKLRSDELLLPTFAATRLKMELDKIPLWRNDSVTAKQLVEDFARYIYLPRLREPSVLLDAICEGVGMLTWESDTFAFADSYDSVAERYVGLRVGCPINIHDTDSPGMLVKSDVAKAQLAKEIPTTSTTETGSSDPADSPVPPNPPVKKQANRFYGTVTLDSARVGRDASRVADEVISHLVALMGSDVIVTLEINASLPNGVTDNIIRTVTENSKTLKFTNQGFDSE